MSSFGFLSSHTSFGVRYRTMASVRAGPRFRDTRRSSIASSPSRKDAERRSEECIEVLRCVEGCATAMIAIRASFVRDSKGHNCSLGGKVIRAPLPSSRVFS
jgi:polyferredoxin